MMTDAEFESRVLAFERAWRRGGPGEIADYPDRPPALRGMARSRLLVELICIDLEFRWRSGARDRASREPPRLESYAAKHPELGPFDRIPLELITQEYRVRWQWGDRPGHAEFLSRFPARREEIRP